jgi:hypothetical protein
MSEMKNPYWDIVQTLPGDEIEKQISGRWMPSWNFEKEQNRDALVQEYAWSIPDPGALAFVARHLAPHAVEIGAGTGYWAWLLSQMGVKMVCYDLYPPQLTGQNRYHSPRSTGSRTHQPGDLCLETRDIFYPVQSGNHEMARNYPDHTLFLNWPPYDDPMAYDTLRAYTGNKLVYIGEECGGCTGDDKFFELLSQEWEDVADCPIVQWWGIHDSITVYERKHS